MSFDEEIKNKLLRDAFEEMMDRFDLYKAMLTKNKEGESNGIINNNCSSRHA